MGRLAAAFLTGAAFVTLAAAPACGGPGPTPASARALATPGRVTYDIAFDPAAGELRGLARFPAGSPLTVAPDEAVLEWVTDVVVASPAGAPAVAHGKDGWTLPRVCAERGCDVSYRVRLRDACRRVRQVDTASVEHEEVLEAPPSSWLLAPEGAAGSTRLAFDVKAPPGWGFVTGVYRSPSGGLELALEDLYTAPYSAFGRFRLRELEVGGSKLHLAIGGGDVRRGDAVVERWVVDSARAVSAYFGHFPVPEALVLVVVDDGDEVYMGKSLSGGGASVLVHVGADATPEDLARDWVMTHELTHTAFPAQPRRRDWIEEGLATYVEPIARARIGQLGAEEVWRSYTWGMPQGLPEAGDRGLDNTHTWGRTYWGGALFLLVADVEIRKRTQGKASLETALRAIVDAGGTNAVRWELERAMAVGDGAIGVRVLGDLLAAWASGPVRYDVAALFRDLGVRREGRAITFDDAAPLAWVRKGITPR